MNDLLLLKDNNKCPKCHRQSAPKYLPGQCRNCGMQLFADTDQFKKFEQETGWREYWVWTNDKGWMHRTQVFDERALNRELENEVLDDDYGTESYLNRKIDDSRMELKAALRKIKKTPTYKKVYK